MSNTEEKMTSEMKSNFNHPKHEETITDELPDNSPLRYACRCGHRVEFARVSDVDFIHHHVGCDKFTADCPNCETARPTKVLDGSFNGESLVCVIAGTFIDNPNKTPTGYPQYVDLENAEFENTPNIVEMATGVFIIRCGECEYLFDEDDRKENSEAPEVGWEYYDCPECGEKTRADVAEVYHDTT